MVNELKQRSDEICLAVKLAHDFMAMMKLRRFGLLVGWKKRVRRAGVPSELRVFADGLDQDGDAVKDVWPRRIQSPAAPSSPRRLRENRMNRARDHTFTKFAGEPI